MPSARRIEIGSRLRDARVAARLSQQDAALEVKVSDSTISAWEAGTRMPGAESLADLCLAYGVSADQILFGTPMVPEALRDVFKRAAAGPSAGR